MKKVYLDNAATSIVPPSVLEVAEKFTSLYKDSSNTTALVHTLQNSMAKARGKVAAYINCGVEEVALVQSTSHALGILASSLPLTKEDNVLICDLEYQASVVCWHKRKEEIGFELREVKTKNGIVTAEDFKEYIDKNTKVILLASVQEINGFRADVKEIGKLAKEYGCYYIVDGIQEVGAFRVDVKDIGADFYCAGGKKWLCNPFGMGFLYIKKEHLKHLRPIYYSYFDIDVPDKYDDYLTYLEDPRRHPFDEYEMNKAASVFEIGGYGNYLGAMGLSESIEVLQNVGMKHVESQIHHLNKILGAGLEKLGVIISGSRKDKHLSSIVAFNFGLENNSVEKERRLIKFLKNKNIYVSLRCSTGVGGVRVSVHYYTKEEDIKVFLDTVKEFLVLETANLGKRE